MPEHTIDWLILFLRQNHGRLSRRAQEKGFARRTDAEPTRYEAADTDLFQRDGPGIANTVHVP